MTNERWCSGGDDHMIAIWSISNRFSGSLFPCFRTSDESSRARLIKEELEHTTINLEQAQKEIAELRIALQRKKRRIQEIEPELLKIKTDYEALNERLIMQHLNVVLYLSLTMRCLSFSKFSVYIGKT